MVSKVHSFELGVHSTWFREYGVHGFGGTGVHSFSLPS